MRALLLGLLFANVAHADRKIQVLDVRYPESPAWGTNTATLTIRNSADQPRDVMITWQASTLALGRNWSLDTTETIPAAATRTLTFDFIIPAFPGTVPFRLRVRDIAAAEVVWERKNTYEFPFANPRANPLRIPPPLLNAIRLSRAEYPALRMEARGRVVIYFLEGDTYVEKRIESIAAERNRVYREIAAKLNPGFDAQVAVYLFPDAASKYAYTMHQGMGMANGRILAEIYNEKEHIDPSHEVTHIIAGSIGDPPALFNEGFAAWSQEGHRWDGIAADSWAKAFAAHGMLWPMEKIFAFREFGSEASRAPIAYPQGASIVNFLIERYGFDKFLKAYRSLKNASSPQENAAKFAHIFGCTPGDMEQAWLAGLKDPVIAPAPDQAVAAIQAAQRK